jgi:hypothetical protein
MLHGSKTFTPRVQAKRRDHRYHRAHSRPAPGDRRPPEEPAMLRLACLLLSFTGSPAACAPAPVATPAPLASSAPCRARAEETTVATAGAPAGHAAAAEGVSPAAPATPPASAPRPASAPPRVRPPSWQQRLPGMFR